MRTEHSPLTGWFIALALALGLAAPAAAQVMRCVDPANGRVTYTDEGCAHGATAHEVAPRQSAEEIAQERAQAEQALQRKYERQRTEAELQRAAATARPPSGAAQAAAPDPAQSAQCQRARQTLQDVLAHGDPSVYDDQQRSATAQRQADLACLSPAEYARLQAQRAAPAPYPAMPGYTPPVVLVPPHPHHPQQRPPQQQPRREITQCNVFRCYDKNGNSYPR